MIALWIIGVLLALIVLLCWNRVGVHAVFGDELLLDARIGVFHIHILPGKEPDKEKKKREKKETDDTEKYFLTKVSLSTKKTFYKKREQ